MRRMRDLLNEQDEEVQRLIRLEMSYHTKLNWEDWFIYKEYEKYMNKILEKLETWYLKNAADVIEENVAEERIKIAIVFFEKREDYAIPLPVTEHNTRTILIPINESSKKALMKEKSAYQIIK